MCFSNNWESIGSRNSKKARGKAPAELPAGPVKIADLFTMKDERSPSTTLNPSRAAAVVGGCAVGTSSQPENPANKQRLAQRSQETSRTQETWRPAKNPRAALALTPGATHQESPPKKSKSKTDKGKNTSRGRSPTLRPRLARLNLQSNANTNNNTLR